jgi:hypothetical protein
MLMLVLVPPPVGVVVAAVLPAAITPLARDFPVAVPPAAVATVVVAARPGCVGDV